MKSYNKIRFGVILVVAAALLFIHYSYAVGWIVGWLILHILKLLRQRFYSRILDVEKANYGKYASYYVFIFLLLWLPPLISFLLPSIINPYALIITYALDRIELYIIGIFFRRTPLAEE